MKSFTKNWLSTLLSVLTIEVAHRAPGHWYLLAFAVLVLYRLVVDVERGYR